VVVVMVGVMVIDSVEGIVAVEADSVSVIVVTMVVGSVEVVIVVLVGSEEMVNAIVVECYSGGFCRSYGFSY